MADYTVSIVIKGVDEAGPAFHSVAEGTDQLGNAFSVLDGIVLGLGSAIADLAISAISELGRAVGDLAVEMVSSNAQFEQYETQFTVLLGSLDAAQERMEELAEFGRTTPFDLPGVVEADRILQGFGLHAEDVAEKFGFSGDEIRRIAGDVAAGTGTSFQEMALLIGRFSSGATGEALMRMAELGIGTRAQLAEMGIEFAKSGQLLSPLPEAMEAVLTLMQDKYGGLMEAQSATFDGMMSNLRDWAGQTIREIGQPIFEILRDKLEDLLLFLGSAEVSEAIDSVANALGVLVGWLADLMLPAIEEAITRLPGFVDAIANVSDELIEFLDLLMQGDFVALIARALGVSDDDPIIDKLLAFKDGIIEFGGSIATFAGEAANAISEFGGAVASWWDTDVQPIVDKIKLWFDDILPEIVARFAVPWREEVLPELEEVWSIIDSRILSQFNVDLPSALEVVTGFIREFTRFLRETSILFDDWSDGIGGLSDTLTSFLNASEKGASATSTWFDQVGRKVDEFYQVWVRPSFESLEKWLAVTIPDTLAQFQQSWDEHMIPAFAELERVWVEELEPALDNLIEAFQELMGESVTADDVLNANKRTLDGMTIVVNLLVAGIEGLAAGFEVLAFSVQGVIDFVDNLLEGWVKLNLTVRAEVMGTIRDLQDAWMDLQADIGAVHDFIDLHVIPLFEALGRVATELGELGLTILAGVWENILFPPIQAVWEFLDMNVFPIFRALSNFFEGRASETATGLARIWTETVLPALMDVWEFIDTNLLPIFRELSSFVSDVLGEALRTFDDKVLEPLLDAFRHIDRLLDNITLALNQMANGLENLDENLPDWLRPESPPPFEIGLLGISNAMQQLSNIQLPGLSTALTGIGGGASPNGSALSQFTSQEIYNLTINSNAPAERAVDDLNVMRALAGRKT